MDIVGSTFTSVVTSAKSTAANLTTDQTRDKVVEGLSSARDGASQGLAVVADKTKESLEVAGTVTAEGLSVVAEKTKQGAEVFYGGLQASGTVVKDKLDETGITDSAVAAGGYVAGGAKVAGGFVYEKGSEGLSMLNNKIDEHESLANAKRAAAEKASQASAYVSSFFGWGKSAEAV